MQPVAVVVVVVAVGIFGTGLLLYCLKRMGRDVFISQTFNVFSGKLSEPSRPFRRATKQDGAAKRDETDEG